MQRGVFGHAQRCGLELLQVLDGACVTMPFFGPSLAGRSKQHHRHVDVDQMGSDLRAHHAGAEHGDLADLESFDWFMGFYSTRIQVWLR
jgi:hypothetical protein